MENAKLKLKIGEHEFEAEGTAEAVQAQFSAFRELVEGMLAAKATTTAQPLAAQLQEDLAVLDVPAAAKPRGSGDLMLDKIMRTEGRLVSLTARGSTLEDEIFLVMLGQRVLRQNESVTGGEILDGLRLTGRTVARIDYQLDKMTTAGDVITVGANRGRRYRLTNQGFAKAQEKALDLLATVA